MAQAICCWLYPTDEDLRELFSVVLPKLAMSKINVKKADMSLMCLCIMPWLAFTADWGTSSRNHTFHKGYICGWLYSWYCDLQSADQSVQQESHDSRSIGTSPKNAWCWLHTRCNCFWFLDLGYGHSQMWEAAVAILLMDMGKTWCKPTKSTFHVLIDVHQWAGKCKQVEIWCPRSDLLVLNHPQPPYTCWWALLEMEVSQNSWDNVWLELERF